MVSDNFISRILAFDKHNIQLITLKKLELLTKSDFFSPEYL